MLQISSEAAKKLFLLNVPKNGQGQVEIYTKQASQRKRSDCYGGPAPMRLFWGETQSISKQHSNKQITYL